jgi:hypothetical protein
MGVLSFTYKKGAGSRSLIIEEVQGLILVKCETELEEVQEL